MKKYISLIILAIAIFLSACQDYEPDTPEACMTISRISGYNENGQAIYEESSTFSVDETVIISSCDFADKFAVYYGKEGSVYGQDGAVGTSLSSDPDAIVSTTYDTTGTFTVTLIATNYSMGSTDVELVRSVISSDIQIIE